MDYYIVTEINGIKQYVRRYRANSKGYIAVTMVTTNIHKAMKFTQQRSSEIYNKMGIGYAITTN